MGLNLSLVDQLAFYGAYHNNKWNQLIHFFFVPSILWTVLVWLAYTGPMLPPLPDIYMPPPPFTRWGPAPWQVPFRPSRERAIPLTQPARPQRDRVQRRVHRGDDLHRLLPAARLRRRLHLGELRGHPAVAERHRLPAERERPSWGACFGLPSRQEQRSGQERSCLGPLWAPGACRPPCMRVAVQAGAMPAHAAGMAEQQAAGGIQCQMCICLAGQSMARIAAAPGQCKRAGCARQAC